MSSGVYNSLPNIELTEDTVENVYYRYNFEKDLWISNIAIKDKKIVLNSNLFMQMYQSIQEYGDNYRKPHFIYSRIKTVYDNSVNDIDNKIFIEINDIIEKFERKISMYYPKFKNNFIYKDYYISFKCKNNNSNDSRDINITVTDNIMNIWCGKISLIFEIENYIKDFI